MFRETTEAGAALTRVYKILSREAWRTAEGAGVFLGGALDQKDGYIHLSAAHQARETARLHFFGMTDLVLLSLEAEALGARLIWEASRGGALFPHLYGPLDPVKVLHEQALVLNQEGWPDPGPLEP